MIAWLSGKIIGKRPDAVVIEAGGVGYQVFISLPTYHALPDENEIASLHIHTNVKEDAFQLFGFATKFEQEVFQRLLGISKIGPKLALTILSGISSHELVRAVHLKDFVKLSAIPGVGAKTADRIVLELSDKLANLMAGVQENEDAEPLPAVNEDAVGALMSLGYKKTEAQRAVKEAYARVPGGELEEIVRNALSALAG